MTPYRFDPVAVRAELIDLDRQFQVEEVPIPARPVKAIGALSTKYRLPLPLSSPLGAFVNAFLKELYQDLVKMTFRMSESVILVGGNLFRFIVPVFYGRVRIGLKETVPDITEELFSTLREEERQAVAKRFEYLWTLMNNVSPISHPCSIDAKTAVDQMLGQKPSYGLSRWSSLQAAEKYIKDYISQDNGVVQKTHNLELLAAEAENRGLPELPRDAIASVQCRAEVRYNAVSTRAEAIRSHYGSLEILAAIARHRGLQAWETHTRVG